MATQTTNLNLVKPAENDAVDITVINSNMDKIDAAIGSASSPVLEINCGTVASLPTTKSNTKITSGMIAIGAKFGTPANVESDLTVTTSNGSVTVSGTISGSTTLVLYLAIKQ